MASAAARTNIDCVAGEKLSFYGFMGRWFCAGWVKEENRWKSNLHAKIIRCEIHFSAKDFVENILKSNFKFALLLCKTMPDVCGKGVFDFPLP